MYTRQSIQKKTPRNSASEPVQTSLLRSRPFNNEAERAGVPPQQQEMPDIATQLDRAKRFGHSFSRVQVQADTAEAIQPKLTVGAPGDKYEQEADSVASQVMSMAAPGNQQPIQREMAPEQEQESVQAKPLAASITPLIQREMAPEQEEEEPLQAKSLSGTLQREAAPEQEEEETVQAKPLSGTLQRETAPEQEEEPLQAKPLSGTLQRETAPEQEQEEPLQAKPLSGTLQRETAPEQEQEELLQAKPLSGTLQRETAPEQEEEEPVQAKPLSGTLQRETAPEQEEEPLQAKRSQNDSFQTSSNLESQLTASKGSGNPLPDEVRAFMEPRFGADFSEVRVHTDSQAVQMNKEIGAQAFTHGNDIYFGAGKSPAISDLTAHELTHVVQQTPVDMLQREPKTTKPKPPDNWDLMAQELGNNDYADYRAGLMNTTFLGKSVTNVHQELADKLQAAEPQIKKNLGENYTLSVDSTLRPKQSFHGWGLAIDFNVLTNPYVLGEAADSPELNKELSQAYDEIANFMLGQSSSINLLKKGRSALGKSVGDAYDKLLAESNEMKKYFVMMDDKAQLQEFLINNWSRLHPDVLASPSQESLDAEIKNVQKAMKKNYMILGGKDENNQPMPTAKGSDRPFAPNSTGKKGDPKTGFLNIPKEVVTALTDAGFSWGAIDLTGESGDIQHFDTRSGQFGQKVLGVLMKYSSKK